MVLFVFANPLKASIIVWADSLMDASSQMLPRNNCPNAFSAKQALGSPSVMPDFGTTPAAWMPDVSRKGLDWIKVAFTKPIHSSQIAIAENINPGAISKILLYDTQGNEIQVFSELSPSAVSRSGRMFNVFFERTELPISAVKIEVVTKNYIDVYQIDAIGICDCIEPIVHRINLPNEYEIIGEKENLGNNINSRWSELAPIITADGQKIFFTRDKHPDNIGDARNQDVWFAELDSFGKFSKAVNIGSPINNERNNFAIGASQDGNTIFVGNVYNPDGTLSKGISKSQRTADGWSFPEKIIIEDYYNNNQHASYAFGANGKVMLLSIERDDTFGGSDLYVSFLQNDGNWSAPKNLGGQVNTADNEEAPFLAADGISLYYSTAGLPGYGSNDMFLTKRLDSTWENWSEPINLGHSINTKGWDGYYTITASGDWAYFVSNENSFGAEDIFRIRLPKELKPKEVVLVRGKVLNSKTGNPLEAKIIYETLSDGQNAGIARSDPTTGQYTITLPGGESYGFLAEAKGFASINENIDLSELTEYQVIERDLFLVPIETGQTVRLNNIFFDFGKFDILPQSHIELQRVIKLLNENSDVKIIIEGHTDSIGNPNSNRILSENRAKSVYDYLINNGIDRARLKFRGFGATKPVADNSSEEGRLKNRRVEFVIQ